MKLTLLIRFYKPTKNEINYWENNFSEMSKYANVHFLIDGTDVKFNDSIPKNIIFKSEKNVGRFYVVYNHLKKHNVNTDFFKVLDCDDYISISNLSKVNFKSSYIDNIIVTKAIKYFGERFLDQTEVERYTRSLSSNLSSRWKSGFASYITFYPTNKILDFDCSNFPERIDFAEDTILALMAISNGSKRIKGRIKNFTIYHSGVGVTRLENVEEEIIGNLHSLKIINSFDRNCKYFAKKSANSILKWSVIKSRKYNSKFGKAISREASESLMEIKDIVKNMSL